MEAGIQIRVVVIEESISSRRLTKSRIINSCAKYFNFLSLLLSSRYVVHEFHTFNIKDENWGVCWEARELSGKKWALIASISLWTVLNIPSHCSVAETNCSQGTKRHTRLSKLKVQSGVQLMVLPRHEIFLQTFHFRTMKMKMKLAHDAAHVI